MTLDHNPYACLGQAWKAFDKSLFSLEHGRERINHGRNERLENLFKLGILFTLIDLFDEMVQDTDDQLLLLGSREFLELVRLQHETAQNGRNILFRESVIDVFHLDFLHRGDETFGIDFTIEFLEDDIHYNVCIL